jgi:microsomal dipeptidase-like Zn-dependent dipeptidase
MNRREFLKYSAAVCASITLGNTSAYANWLWGHRGWRLPPGLLVIDAHAHPDQFYYLGPEPKPQAWIDEFGDESSTLKKIRDLGMQGSSFAAIGDSTFADVLIQVDRVINLEEQHKIKIVRNSEDLPDGGPRGGFIPRAILSLEGTSALGTDFNTVSANLDILYNRGVRMITLMHKADNQFGEAMLKEHTDKTGTGLTVLGGQVVERIMDLGIVVDVAHAHYATLEDIAGIAGVKGIPLIDSHTSLSPCEDFCGGRLRIWDEMEMVTATGGVVCTWPYKWERADGSGRLTIQDWTEENYEMKERLGSGHVALGTDGGGVLPAFVDGYESILDLPKLIKAMYEIGFGSKAIAAYMGRNVYRLIKECIG